MSEMTHEQQLQRMRDQLAGLTASARELRKNLAGAQALASTPDGRAKMVAMRHQFSDWRLLLTETVRELAEVDRMLHKALRRPWRLAA